MAAQSTATPRARPGPRPATAHRAVGALGRLRGAGRAGRGGGSVRRLAPCRRDGRALRPQRHIGPPVVASLRRHTPLFFDCHLMMTEPGSYLEDFADAGADGCTVHVEIGNTDELIAQMRSLGLRAGLALNPDTPFEAVAPYLRRRRPGAVHDGLPRLRRPELHRRRHGEGAQVRAEVVPRSLDLDIEVDGGIDADTAPVAVAAGANVFVAGSAIFGQTAPVGSG